MKRCAGKSLLCKGALLLFCAFGLAALSPLRLLSQNMTQSSPSSSQGIAVKPTPGVNYVGQQVCAQCHSSKAKTQQATAMAKALQSVGDCEILRTRPRLTFRSGLYSYEVVRDGNRSIYKVTDGTTAISEPLLWCFGRGGAGQTYLFEHNGIFYQSRVSFYNDTQGLGVTLGAAHAVPNSIDEAAGDALSSSGTRDCFACHSTGAVRDRQLKLDQMIVGVSCEACHGPGERHVAAMRSGNVKDNQIFNPKRLNTEELSNFCGACHRTWEQIASLHLYNINNVRFQPYRLANSQCYDVEDRRISCLACHDAHKDPEHDLLFYDGKCTACHNPDPKLAKVDKQIARTCKVGKQRCVTCHMPKLEIPGSHFQFTDHQIRIVKPGEPYPN